MYELQCFKFHFHLRLQVFWDIHCICFPRDFDFKIGPKDYLSVFTNKYQNWKSNTGKSVLILAEYFLNYVDKYTKVLSNALQKDNKAPFFQIMGQRLF